MAATNTSSYVGRHIDAIQADVQVISFGHNEAGTHSSGKYLIGNVFIVTIDDIVVSQSVNRRAAHGLYAKALAKIDSMGEESQA